MGVRTVLHGWGRPVFAAAVMALALPLAALGGLAGTCPGDCNGDGSVIVNELIIGVNIALEQQPVTACPAFDRDGDGTVLIAELIAAVAAALSGCPSTPTATDTAVADTPTASPEATSSATASPSPTAPDSPTPTVSESATPMTPGPPTITPTETPATAVRFCDLPGSYQTTAPGVSVVPGGPTGGTNLGFMKLPIGFCAHFFSHTGNPRQLRFAPTGELFVASPTRFTTSSGTGGQAAILVLPDDDGDGVADSSTKFLKDQALHDVELRETIGLLFANDHLYYQDGRRIMRVPYTPGDRTTSNPSELVADISIYEDGLHWSKPMDIADDGTIYVGNGSYENEGTETNPRYAECALEKRPFRGGILKLDGSPGGTPVAMGFRNPISLRCARGHNRCFAIELAKDFSYAQGGREKILQIHEGDDWGFPCCASKDTPYTYIRPVPDCSHVVQESESFYIGNTPFDLDFEKGRWPEPWKDRVFVAVHGSAGLWKGARLVAVEPDSMTGELIPGSDLSGTSSGGMADFATGWETGTGTVDSTRGRPTVVAFAEDGRLFLGNDRTEEIIWIAPMELEIPR